MILNETPIRTSKNYEINNINIADFNLPKTIKKFEGLNITGDKVLVKEEKIKGSLKYGNGKDLLSQLQNSSNINLHIILPDENEKEINLEFNLSEENENLVEDILIEAEENAKGTIIIKYMSNLKDEVYHNGQLRVLSKKGSDLNVILLNLLNTKAQNFISIENVLEENSNVKYTMVDFGGKNSITNYYTNLKGENSNNNINTIYLGVENQLLDLNYIVEAYGKSSNVNINVKGAIKDSARKHFKGTIDFKKNCKKAKGNETEYCTILSDSAKSISLPMLLCTEEDVEGNHGTASGKVDEKQLFYLMSRGLSLKEAQKLIVRGQFNEIIESIPNEDIQNMIVRQIENKL